MQNFYATNLKIEKAKIYTKRLKSLIYTLNFNNASNTCAIGKYAFQKAFSDRVFNPTKRTT